jgi:CRP-like cAMP-binding protein
MAWVPVRRPAFSPEGDDSLATKTRTTLFPSWDACIPHTDIWIQAGGIGRVRRCKRGEVLYSQHQPHRYFYLLRSGFVRADMGRENGRRLTLEVMGPGSLFGEGAAFDGGLRYVDAWCVTDVVLSIYEPAEVSRAPEGIALFESLVKIMSAKQRVLAAKLLHFAESNPELRLRQLLARIVAVQQRIHSDPRGNPLDVPYTQDQLADMCGLSRISVTRALKRLGAEGIAVTHLKHVEVLDPAALALQSI